VFLVGRSFQQIGGSHYFEAPHFWVDKLGGGLYPRKVPLRRARRTAAEAFRLSQGDRGMKKAVGGAAPSAHGRFF